MRLSQARVMKGIVHANTGVAREFLWHGTDTQHRTNCGTEVDQVDTYFSYQCATLPDCPTKVDTFAPKIDRNVSSVPILPV